MDYIRALLVSFQVFIWLLLMEKESQKSTSLAWFIENERGYLILLSSQPALNLQSFCTHHQSSSHSMIIQDKLKVPRRRTASESVPSEWQPFHQVSIFGSHPQLPYRAVYITISSCVFRWAIFLRVPCPRRFSKAWSNIMLVSINHQERMTICLGSEWCSPWDLACSREICHPSN